MDPPGLRRLRFPFFDSLVKERSGRSNRDSRLGSRRSVVVETRLITQSTRGSLVFNPEIACPLPRTSTWRTKLST
jgi:hypothetical protein